MENHNIQHEAAIKNLKKTFKKINAVHSYFTNKSVESDSLKLQLKILKASIDMVNSIINKPLDLSGLKPNEIESKILELNTTANDVNTLYEKVEKKIEKETGKKITFKTVKKK